MTTEAEAAVVEVTAADPLAAEAGTADAVAEVVGAVAAESAMGRVL